MLPSQKALKLKNDSDYKMWDSNLWHIIKDNVSFAKLR